MTLGLSRGASSIVIHQLKTMPETSKCRETCKVATTTLLISAHSQAAPEIDPALGQAGFTQFRSCSLNASSHLVADAAKCTSVVLRSLHNSRWGPPHSRCDCSMLDTPRTSLQKTSRNSPSQISRLMLSAYDLLFCLKAKLRML